ncbi:hypothetical protein [Anaerostipes sp. Marseille-Q3525]|uniref:hypothetical protein n=1 Tax=Anaerostipes sp. Marseille-Q3525 TaxID=2758418 RepID=UPI001BA54881|nr:hypothetical protein [Anaerostipes sp. Marseille-Q3525]MBR9961898.1 hypothetical protein [Anaerostipes sp. Marseille-Q3525]
MSKKNTREFELAFSKSRDPDWEADVEIYRRRKFGAVRGICLGDEFTEIDSLECKNCDKLNEMYYRFYFNLKALMKSYLPEYTDYVLIETMHIISPAILCCDKIVLKNGEKISIDNICIDTSNGNEVYKLYSNSTYTDDIYYESTKALVHELASKDVYKTMHIMTDIMNEAYVKAKNERNLHPFISCLFNDPPIPCIKKKYSIHDLAMATSKDRCDIYEAINTEVPNAIDMPVCHPGRPIEHYFELDYTDEVEQFIKEQEAKKCEETK